MALVQKQFGDLITFTRASAGGRFNAAGVFEMVPANQPRFDFDPVTKLPRGILIEGARTNLLLQSSALESGYWTKGSGVELSKDGKLAPDGTPMTLVTLSGAESHQIVQNLGTALTPGLQYTLSLFVEAKSDPFPVQLAYYLGGVPHIAGATQPTQIGVIQRIQVTFTPTASGASPHIRVIGYGNGVNGAQLYIWHAQLEAGTMTSPIPTTTAQVTRAADVARVNVLSPWFNPAEGTLYVEVEPASLDINNWYAALTDGTLNNAIDIGTAAGGRSRSRVLVGGATEASVSSIDQLTKISKIATAYRKGLMVNATNGKVRSAALANLPTSITTLGIGMIATFQYSPGLIRSIRYYPRSLTDSELQALTT